MKIKSKEKFVCLPLNTKRDDLRLGELVITYGQIQNFDKENCSIGIINQPKQTFSKYKTVNEKDTNELYPYIQISNPINSGMSGSPLLDAQCNLIGMIQKKIDNYGLALPINILKNVAKNIQQHGKYKGPFLGAILKLNDFSINKADNYTGEITVLDVLPNSPADISGLQKKDILLKINDIKMQNIADVHEVLNSVWEKYVLIEILRGKEKLKLKVDIF